MNWDTRLFLAINQHTPFWLASIFYAITLIGSPAASLIWLCVLAVASRGDRYRRFLFGAVTLVVAMFIDLVLKYAIARPRPWRTLSQTHVIGHLELGPSFPSGHATASFALAVAVSLAWPRLRGAPLVLAVLIALSRPVVGMHYPLDVLCGAWLGTTVTLVGWFAWGRQRCGVRSGMDRRPDQVST